MKTTTMLLGVLLAAAPAIAGAQYMAPMPVGQQQAGMAVLRAGTDVSLRLSEELTTKGKALRPGYRFHLEVAQPVILNGVTVIPAGTPAMGEVTDVRNKGMWGKSGRINARVLYMTVNGRQVRMSGSFDDKGTTGTAGVVAAIAFVPVVGFFTTGTSAHMPVGTTVRGFLDEDVPLAMAAVAPQPLAVAAPMGMMPVAAPAPQQVASRRHGR